MFRKSRTLIFYCEVCKEEISTLKTKIFYEHEPKEKLRIKWRQKFEFLKIFMRVCCRARFSLFSHIPHSDK